MEHLDVEMRLKREREWKRAQTGSLSSTALPCGPSREVSPLGIPRPRSYKKDRDRSKKKTEKRVAVVKCGEVRGRGSV